MKKIRHKFELILGVLVFAFLLFSAVFVAIRITFVKSDSDWIYERSRSEYVLMLLQCILGIVALLLPGWLNHKFNIKIPSGMIILYVLFLFGAIYLGEVRSFYYKISNWDDILHCMSGGMIGALGFSFVAILNKSDRVPMNLSCTFVSIFAFCFAITMGVAWELYEYTFDGLLGLNMQKFMLEDGTMLVGHAALRDTMKDLLVDGIGAGVVSILGGISLKYKKGWIEKIMIHIKRNKLNKK